MRQFWPDYGKYAAGATNPALRRPAPCDMERPDREADMATISSFQTRDNVKIVYELHGDPAAKDRVVLIHSLAMDHAYWRPVAERWRSASASSMPSTSLSSSTPPAP